MTVKVLVTALGQQLIASAKQIENKDSGDLVGYWLENARQVSYVEAEGDDGGLSVNFGAYCLVSDEASFSVRSEHIVAILEPRDDVREAYERLVVPADATVEVTEDDATNSPDPEGSDSSDLADGTAGDGTEGAS